MRALLLIPILLGAGCGGGEKNGKTVLRGEAMGTGWSVVIPGGEEVPEGVRDRVVEEIAEVEGAMSTWIEESEVSRFNRLGAGETMVLSAETVKVVACSLEVWKASGGAFDITVGSGVAGGSEHLELDRAKGALTKRRDGISIDLSAVAKGYGVDRVAEALDRLGVENYLVEIGGELRGKGEAVAGRSWTVGIERPEIGGGRVMGTVELAGKSVATSGNYLQPKHLIDPSTGKPVEREYMAVSVMHASAMVADAWATALFVAGEKEAMKLAEREGLAMAILSDRGGDADVEVKTTRGFVWKDGGG